MCANRVEFLLVPSALLALVVNHDFTPLEVGARPLRLTESRTRGRDHPGPLVSVVRGAGASHQDGGCTVCIASVVCSLLKVAIRGVAMPSNSTYKELLSLKSHCTT